MAAPTKKKTTPPRSAERTKAVFLRAAEEVFGKQGYEGTTIRAISRIAGVNLGTLQHYWGSKRQLLRDLFETRFGPLKVEVTRRLKLVEAKAAGGRPDAAELLRALLEATFLIGLEGQSQSSRDNATERSQFHRLYGRALMDPSPIVVVELNRIFKDPVQRFLVLMRRALPQLSAAELDWRFNCIVGAQGFSLVYSERVGSFFAGEADVDAEKAVKWIVHFLVNGINASPLG